MRTIIPAIAVVVLLCMCMQWKVEQWRYFRAAEDQMRQKNAARAAHSQPAPPTSQPATQPVDSPLPAKGLD